MFNIFYVLMILFCIFVITPFLRIRMKVMTDYGDLSICIIGSMVWPVPLLIVILYFLIYLPSVYFYGIAEKAWIVAPIVPSVSNINEAKSTYRHTEFVDEDMKYNPSNEI